MIKGGKPIGRRKTGGRASGTPNRATAALKEKLAALGCDPAEELVKIAQDLKTPVAFKAHIYAVLMPYVYPKRKLAEDYDEERLGVDPQAISPEEALELARDLIAIFGPRAAPLLEASGPLIESESDPEGPDDES
jgi:hypothetical protein